MSDSNFPVFVVIFMGSCLIFMVVFLIRQFINKKESGKLLENLGFHVLPNIEKDVADLLVESSLFYPQSSFSRIYNIFKGQLGGIYITLFRCTSKKNVSTNIFDSYIVASVRLKDTYPSMIRIHPRKSSLFGSVSIDFTSGSSSLEGHTLFNNKYNIYCPDMGVVQKVFTPEKIDFFEKEDVSGSILIKGDLLFYYGRTVSTRSPVPVELKSFLEKSAKLAALFAEYNI